MIPEEVEIQSQELVEGTLAPSAVQLAPQVATNILTQGQKAAIIVQFLLGEGVSLPLSTLSASEQARLIHLLGQMQAVDSQTLSAVIDEFLHDLGNVGLSFSGGLEAALNALSGSLDEDVVAGLRASIAPPESQTPWDRLALLESDDLLELLSPESIEICAVVLSKLSVNKAAETLSKMPGERARRITYAVSLTTSVTPQAVEIIGQSLIERYDDKPETAFADDPIERVGAILNFAAARTRDDVLEGLEQTDKSLAEDVRKSIFTFENIPARLTERDIPKITKDVDTASLTVALGAAIQNGLEEAANFVLDNMSKRLAQGVRDDMEGLGAISEEAGEAAMAEVVSAIRELEASGEIVLQIPDN